MNELFSKRFLYYKSLADAAFEQISEEDFFWKYNEESNSIAIIVQHIAGNMLSRWTNFLVEDGEKPWRNRDREFENTFATKNELIDYWEKGWACLLHALQKINDDNLETEIFIRGEKYTVMDAVLRQLAHYPYHIGQIIYIAKMRKNTSWKSLSIPRNQSALYNQQMKDSLNDSASPVCYSQDKDIRDEYKS